MLLGHKPDHSKAKPVGFLSSFVGYAGKQLSCPVAERDRKTCEERLKDVLGFGLVSLLPIAVAYSVHWWRMQALFLRASRASDMRL